MTDHDPLCPATLGRYVSGTGLTPNECQCALIAKVRADERERIAQAIAAIPRAVDGGTEPSIWDTMIYRDTAVRIARGESALRAGSAR